MPQDEFAKILPQIEFKRLTANSIGNSQELETQLQKVRRNGHAFDLEENEQHIRCVGGSNLGSHGHGERKSEYYGSCSPHVPHARPKQLAPLVQEAGSEKISRS